MGTAPAAILGLGTALPPFRGTCADALDWVERALAADPAAVRLARRVLERAGVETRYSCVPDFLRPGEPLLLGSRSPGTSARMQAYREHAPRLAACRRALASAEVGPEEISSLVVVSCTGFFAPGPDVSLVRELGLRDDMARTVVGFMGCYAGFNGLRVARDAVAARPGSKALVVCVELCTLHFRPDPQSDNVVAKALFGDGAAAVVVGDDGDRALARLGDAATLVQPDTVDEMGWEIGDDGFRMHLSSYVPKLLSACLADFVAPLRDDRTSSWCVHPGGRAILDHVQDALSLPSDALASSRDVLRDVGNVSSATVFFVLERELRRMRTGDRGVMLGFGPGLTLEALAFARGARSVAAPQPELVGAGDVGA